MLLKAISLSNPQFVSEFNGFLGLHCSQKVLYDVDASTSAPLLPLAGSVFQLFLCVTDSLDRGILDKTLAAAEGDPSIDHVF